ncbi:MAG: hypothetical protein AB7S75_22715, partial [Desulfococcaceae bacterium]
MKVVFHKDFCKSYISDPAAAPGRMESIETAFKGRAEFITAVPASEEDLAAVHTEKHIESVRSSGLYDIAALAAGGAVQAAEIGLTEPCFAQGCSILFNSFITEDVYHIDTIIIKFICYIFYFVYSENIKSKA